MSTRKTRKKIRLWLVLVSFFLFGLGFYLFEVVSRIYKVPFGTTFHIVVGGALMGASGVYIVYATKKIFFTKKKKRSNHIYLKKETLNK